MTQCKVLKFLQFEEKNVWKFKAFMNQNDFIHIPESKEIQICDLPEEWENLKKFRWNDFPLHKYLLILLTFLIEKEDLANLLKSY